MAMKQRLLGLFIWIAIVAALGVFGSYALGIKFWVAAVIAGLALIANGLFAAWEDRRPGGFYDPHGSGNKQ